MKKVKKIGLLCLIICFSFCLTACDFSFVTNWFSDAKNTITNTATTERTLDENETLTKLMETRGTIRAFNVYIEASLSSTAGFFETEKVKQLGSGSVFAKDSSYYYAITNYHVINPSEYNKVSYSVTSFSGLSYTGTVVCSDTTKDMAVIKFSSTNETIPLADISSRQDKALGKDEFVLAVGNPSGVRNVVTYGKYLGMANIDKVSFKVINHNALINPGNSGGALCDIDGYMVGINTWGSENTDTNNYSIPLSYVRNFLQTAQTAGNIPEGTI